MSDAIAIVVTTAVAMLSVFLIYRKSGPSPKRIRLETEAEIREEVLEAREVELQKAYIEAKVAAQAARDRAEKVDESDAQAIADLMNGDS